MKRLVLLVGLLVGVGVGSMGCSAGSVDVDPGGAGGSDGAAAGGQAGEPGGGEGGESGNSGQSGLPGGSGGSGQAGASGGAGTGGSVSAGAGGASAGANAGGASAGGANAGGANAGGANAGGANAGTGGGSAGGEPFGGGGGAPPQGGQAGSAATGSCDEALEGAAEVYGHSATELFRVDAATKAVTKIGDMNCGFFLESVIDLAINKEGQLYGTTFNSLVKIDKQTAKCDVINGNGSYPNSLSFVPAGTIYPDQEALVGYSGSTYLVIDPVTGQVTSKGELTGGYQSSGDIVSVIGGGTYLTVKGNGCSDCLVEVNPVTGDLINNLGPLGYQSVFGLAFWADELYGFDDSGNLFTFNLTTKKATAVPIPNVSSSISFFGAGSSTCARLGPIIKG